MAATGWSQRQLCRELNLDPSEVSRTRRKYSVLPPEVLKDVGGPIPSRGGDALVKLAGHLDVMREFADKLRSGAWSVETAEEKVTEFLAQTTGTKPKKKAKPAVYRHGNIEVIVRGEITDDLTAAQLIELAKKLKKAS